SANTFYLLTATFTNTVTRVATQSASRCYTCLVDLRKKHQKLAADHQTVKYNFILTEIDLARTFCEMALPSDDKAKSLRNKDHALRAQGAAKYFLGGNGFSRSMKANVRAKLASLKTLMRRLNRRHDGFATTKELHTAVGTR